MSLRLKFIFFLTVDSHFCYVSSSQQLAKAKTEVRAREETIKEKQQFLDGEIENNREQEKRIAIAERTASKLRIDLQSAEAARDQFQSEVCNFYFVIFNAALQIL